MKKLLFLAAVLASAGAFASGVAPAVTDLGFQPKQILIVGNSYMYYNCGLNGYLAGLIREKVDPKIKTRISATGRSNMSQQPVEELLDNTMLRSHDPKHGTLDAKLLEKEVAKREAYDLVLLQGSNRGKADQERDAHYVKIHAEAIRAHGGTPAMIMTWVQKKKNAPAQQVVSDGVTRIANDNAMMSIPVGLAFERAEKAHPEWKLIMPDDTHPTALGSYLMASTIYGAVYRRDPSEATGFEGGCEKPLPAEARTEAARIAWETVNNWFGWK